MSLITEPVFCVDFLVEFGQIQEPCCW